MVMYVLLFCSTGFYCACRAGFDLSVYCAVWNQLIAVSDIFGCFKCIAGVSDRNSFYFLEGAIAFFLVNDIAGCSGNFFPGNSLFSAEGFKCYGWTA